ncbi:MAG: hypothetical protein H6739_01565 [Alphaproteobacteria bacterium]|nr:hypothetical protein [Alphaproteobacteria bacterium]
MSPSLVTEIVLQIRDLVRTRRGRLAVVTVGAPTRFEPSQVIRVLADQLRGLGLDGFEIDIAPIETDTFELLSLEFAWNRP